MPATWAIAAGGPIGMLLFALALQRVAVTTVTALVLSVETVIPSILGLAFFGDTVRGGFVWVAVARAAGWRWSAPDCWPDSAKSTWPRPTLCRANSVDPAPCPPWTARINSGCADEVALFGTSGTRVNEFIRAVEVDPRGGAISAADADPRGADPRGRGLVRRSGRGGCVGRWTPSTRESSSTVARWSRTARDRARQRGSRVEAAQSVRHRLDDLRQPCSDDDQQIGDQADGPPPSASAALMHDRSGDP